MVAEALSAAVLAGGYSRRMGRDKAGMMLEGKSLLERQVDKLRALGIRDVMLSGTDSVIPGCRNVADRFPHRGPLSGIHACLLASKHPACLVLSVDSPLVPPETLFSLIESHTLTETSGITALRHDGQTEPLIAVYDRALYPMAEQLLHSERTAIMRLLAASAVRELDYEGDEFLLCNCNTPEEYERISTYCREGRSV